MELVTKAHTAQKGIQGDRAAERLEEDASPHAHPEAVADPEDEIKRRRLSITLEHLRAHGYTPACRRCELHRQGLQAAAGCKTLVVQPMGNGTQA